MSTVTTKSNNSSSAAANAGPDQPVSPVPSASASPATAAPPPELFRPPDAVLALFMRTHEAAANALAVMQSVMKAALANPTEKLPAALNQARIAAAQVLRFASRLITPPPTPQAPGTPGRAARSAVDRSADSAPMAAALHAAAGTAPNPAAAVKGQGAAASPSRLSSSAITQMIREFIARTGDAPARPAPTTPPRGSTAQACRSQ